MVASQRSDSPHHASPRILQRAAALVLIALALAAASGCVTRRPSVLVGDPIDLASPIAKETLDEVLRAPGMHLGGEQEYYLGPGDELSIYLIGRPDVLGTGPGESSGGVTFILTESPYISLPMVGAIKVHNKTAAQVQAELEQAYSQFIRDPRPLVLVRLFARNRITVLGSVQRPATYPYEFGDTIMDAIFKAGGLSMGGRSGGMAPSRYLRIYRQRITPEERAQLTMEQLIERLTSREGTIVPREEIAVPMREMIFGATLDYNLPLRADDVIYIAPAGSAHVQGRVDQPGVVFLGPSVSTLTQVLTERGGMRFSANSIVEVFRTYPDGQAVTYHMNARDMFGRKQRDFVIQDGDQVIVYGASLRTIGEFLGQLFRGSVTAGASATYNPAAGI